MPSLGLPCASKLWRDDKGWMHIPHEGKLRGQGLFSVKVYTYIDERMLSGGQSQVLSCGHLNETQFP